MKSIVFGASGFIGSHLVEQIQLSGHDVTAVIRKGANTDFLSSIKVNIIEVDFSQYTEIVDSIAGHSHVYNCLANPKMHQSLDNHRKVEVRLTQQVMQAACDAKATRFIQLSTVQVYGFSRPPTPIDENYAGEPTYHFNQVAQEREAAVKEIAKQKDIELVIARPVNTMSKRDKTTQQLFKAHRQGIMVAFGDGQNRFSCVDTRDVGRAMLWLGQLPEAAGHTYLISGYETTWREMKQALDSHHGKPAKFIRIPALVGKAMAQILEKLTPYNKELSLVPFAVAVMSTQTLFDDRKIRATGFSPKYQTISETIDGYYS